MNIVISSVVPVVLLLILGNLLRRYHIIDGDFWRQSDKLTYFILFPSLIITKIAKVNLAEIDITQLYLSVVIFFIIMSVIVYIIYKYTCDQANQFSSVYQSVTRFNSYLFIALAAEVWGQSHLSFVALIIGIVVPTVNLLCVLSFSVGGRSARGHSIDIKKIIISLITNPLIIGCFVGFLVNAYPQLIPIYLFNTLDILSRAALPLALLSVGAAVRVRLILDKSNIVNPVTLWTTSLVRLFIAPMIYWLIAIVFGFDDITTQTLILLAAVPAATSSYILAKQLGGDVDLVVMLISLETVLSIFSLMFWLYIMVG